MRGALFPLTIVLALAATAGLALLAFRDPPDPGVGDPEESGNPELIEERQRAARAPVLRPYQTTATLAEDLRDALAGDAAELEAEVWRVSKAFAARARWTLYNVARQEASPKVRALLVIAAGVHVPDDDVLLGFLDDRKPIVRRAAVLAIDHAVEGREKSKLVEGFEVALGREVPDRTTTELRMRLEREKDPEVRKEIEAALSR